MSNVGNVAVGIFWCLADQKKQGGVTKPQIFLDVNFLVRRNLTTQFEMTYGRGNWNSLPPKKMNEGGVWGGTRKAKKKSLGVNANH